MTTDSLQDRAEQLVVDVSRMTEQFRHQTATELASLQDHLRDAMAAADNGHGGKCLSLLTAIANRLTDAKQVATQYALLADVQDLITRQLHLEPGGGDEAVPTITTSIQHDTDLEG